MSNYDIVIPTHNNYHLKNQSLELVLDSIKHQTLQPNKIIIVSNGDSLDEINWISKISRHLPAEVHPICEANRAKARNIGIKEVTAEMVFFIDDDIIIPPYATQRALEAMRNNEFSCGAHRKYISSSIPRQYVKRMIAEQNWKEIDDSSSDDQVSETGYRQVFNRYPSQSTFIGCFGAVPNRIAKDLLFDERYVGWGLEDTDFMRRLLMLVGFKSISEIDVYHIDHLVSPYQWREHWGKNYSLYLSDTSKYGYLRVYNLFQYERLDRGDRTVLLQSEQKREQGMLELPHNLSASNREQVLKYVKDSELDPNVAALLLTGSAMRKSSPRDIDIIKVTFSGDSGFRILPFEEQYVEEHYITLPNLEATIYHPEYLPDTWFWNIGRYVNCSYLHEKVVIRDVVSSGINATLFRRSTHLLTLHLGGLIRSCRKNDVSSIADGLKHAAALLFLWKEEFPSESKYPYTENSNVKELLDQCYYVMRSNSKGTEDSIMDILKGAITDITSKFKICDSTAKVFLPDSYIGIRALKDYGYGDIDAIWTPYSPK